MIVRDRIENMGGHLNIKRSPKFKDEFSFDSLYKTTLKTELNVDSRPPRIRMSSFPFCPRRFMYECIGYMTGNYLWSFTADFYCGIGTAVHQALQKWVPLANPGYILGNWSCDHCGKWVRDTDESNPRGRIWKPYMVYAKIGPLMCPKCGRPMQYEEFEFILPDAPVSGHCDGVLMFDPSSILNIELTPDNYYMVDRALRSEDLDVTLPAYILEYKTAGLMMATKRAEPKLEHRCQANMYVGAARRILPKKFGLRNLDVRGFLVKYFARDRPQTCSQDLRLEIEGNEFYKQQCGFVNIFDNAMMLGGDYTKAMFKCWPCEVVSTFYDDCPYREECRKVTPQEFRSQVKEVRPLYKKVRIVRPE